jgi:hypothetical protein
MKPGMKKGYIVVGGRVVQTLVAPKRKIKKKPPAGRGATDPAGPPAPAPSEAPPS